jgi:hypothetical protein
MGTNTMTSHPNKGGDHSTRAAGKRVVGLALVAALTLAACGDDDDAADTTASAEGTSTAGTEASGEESAGDTAATEPAGASGSATFSTAEVNVDGPITACEIPNETDLSMTVEGENAGFRVASAGGGEVSVVVTGAVEFEGTGQATVSDAGEVSVAGQGSESDPGATVVDFTITGTINSC